MSFEGGTTVKVTTKNATTGQTTTTSVDLSSLADVYGSTSTCTSGSSCNVRTTEMSASGAGFQGKYGAPSLVEGAVPSARLLQEVIEEVDGRYLATKTVTTGALANPVVCVTAGDSMVFTISSPTHYPVYLKDSVMNSNPSFDYGAFLVLASQMTTKAATNNTTPSLFSFTFSTQGNYVFVDSADSEQLMIVRVTGPGESCTDPDRYIQSISGESVASAGVTQNADIIIKPDVPLLVGMAMILLGALVAVMVGVGYCLHKGWSVPKLILRGYRHLYMKADVDHTCEDTFRTANDFSKFKSYLDPHPGDGKAEAEALVEPEDDLDEMNLNIHLDVLNAGQEYLKVFGDRKHARAVQKRDRKSEVLKMMTEIERLINTIGQDAIVN